MNAKRKSTKKKAPKKKAAKKKAAPRKKAKAPKVVEAELVDDSDEDLSGEAHLPVVGESPDDRLPAADLRAISPSDPLRQYLEELKKYPLLEPEEEMLLALKLRDEGDLNAAKLLVQANLRLVVKIAFEYRTVYTNMLDLIQEGNVGLMKAVSKYDPTKGARVGYYSSWWIRSYILKYILDNFRLVKIGTTQAQRKLFYHLMREKQKLEAQGLVAAPKLLAEKLDVKEKEVKEMSLRLSSSGSEMSIDTPIRTAEGEQGATFKDLLPGEDEGADDRVSHEQLLDILKGKLPQFEEGLNDKERKVLHERLLADDPKTLQEVADQYGLSRERVRQIESKVIGKLREYVKEDMGLARD